MWEDGTYLTNQSDDVDTSPGARLFNTRTTAMQIAISNELKTWNSYLVCWERNTVWSYSILWVLAHTVIC